MPEKKSKSLEELRKELYDMHKQFDSINIEKTLNNNNLLDSKNEAEIKKKITKQNDNINKLEKNIKPTKQKETFVEKIETKVKQNPIIQNIDQLVIDNHINIASNKIEEPIIKRTTSDLKIEKKIADLDPKTNPNNKNLKPIVKDDNNESYLSIKEKLEKIKLEIDSTTTKKNKKYIEHDQLKESLKPTLITKKDNSAVTTKSSVLTLIILILIIITLISIYFVFF